MDLKHYTSGFNNLNDAFNQISGTAMIEIMNESNWPDLLVSWFRKH
ncbi:MAG: hypothetical protein ACI9BD_001554, partial [Candidatus Marinamargulisbacteria bacterium]